MAQGNKPVVQQGGPGQAPPLQMLSRYASYLPFPLVWVLAFYVVLTIVTALVVIVAD